MTTECRAAGTVEGKHVTELANLLRSLCHTYGSYHMHEVTLRLPLASAPSGTTLRFTKRVVGNPAQAQNPFQDEAPDRYEVQCKGPPIRGPHLNDLPASMRETTESVCFGSSTLDFWKALGAHNEQEYIREGNEYHVVYQGFELRLIFAKMYFPPEPGKAQDRNRAAGSRYLLEVLCNVAEGKHFEGAHIIGAFGAHVLQPYTKLVRGDA